MSLKYYLPSENVDMFPITIPRNVSTKQNAHALSEYNLLSLSRHYSDMDSFVISTQFNNPTGNDDVSCLECIIHGYYVNLQFNKDILDGLTTHVYATIVLDNWKRGDDPSGYTPKLVYSDYPPLIVPPSESSQDDESNVDDAEAQAENTDTYTEYEGRYLGVVLSDSVPESVNDLLAVSEYLNRRYDTESDVPDCSAYTLKILTKVSDNNYVIPPESMYKLTSRSISSIDGGEY